MSTPHTHFKNCPACGEAIGEITPRHMICGACGFTYFFNPAIGLAGFIENKHGEILLIERGKEPAKGKFAPPGGFADAEENAEAALSREVFEEVGLRVEKWRYIGSWTNLYTYAGVSYNVIDFFYSATVDERLALDLCPKETLSAKWIPKESIDPAALAFPSMQEAFRTYRKKF